MTFVCRYLCLPLAFCCCSLCCLCGVSIPPNPANMCVTCLRTQVDITEGITKEAILHQCRGCERYLRPPWVGCELESKELLAICLKKINGMSKVKLVDAGFIWTEPHSRRIKVIIPFFQFPFLPRFNAMTLVLTSTKRPVNDTGSLLAGQIDYSKGCP